MACPVQRRRERAAKGQRELNFGSATRKQMNRTPGDEEKTPTGVARREGRRGLFAGKQQYLRQGERLRVRDRQERGVAAHGREPPGGAPMEHQAGRPVAANNLDVSPQHVVGVARTEGLHRCFLSRESSGEMDGRIVTPCTVGDLATCEHAVRKPIVIARDGGGDAGDVGGIESQTDDVRHG